MAWLNSALPKSPARLMSVKAPSTATTQIKKCAGALDWAPQAIQRDSYPQNFHELENRLSADFVRFDQREPLIRGMLASPQGRSARMHTAAARQRGVSPAGRQ
jgi:hypothetical protein